MSEGIRAFSNCEYDYYELQQDLGGIVPAGAIFVHDINDNVNGSPANGCLKLCWTPDGNCYKGRDGSICGGTVVFHTEFINSEMFKKARQSKPQVKTIMSLISSLEAGLNAVKEKLKEL